MSVNPSASLGTAEGPGSVPAGAPVGVPTVQPEAAGAALGVLEGLHPGWFGAVMGTAAVGMAAYANPGGHGGLLTTAHAVGVTLVLIAAAVGLLLLLAYAARWLRHPAQVTADLAHPALGALFATVPGGLLVVAVALNAVAASLPFSTGALVGIVAVLTVLGSVLGLALSLVFAYGLFTGTPPAPMVNGGWFIPPVVTIIIPVALAALVPHVSPSTGTLLVALGYAFFGMGLLLFLLVLTLLHDRLVLHPLPGAPLAPSLWIALGPVGVGALALPVLARAATASLGQAAPAVAAVSKVTATALWGFGFWWLLAAALLLVRYLRAGRLPYSPGWWAFTFPLAAYTLATLGLATAWNAPALTWTAVTLFVVLVAFWATVSVATIRRIATGQAWTR